MVFQVNIYLALRRISITLLVVLVSCSVTSKTPTNQLTNQWSSYELSVLKSLNIKNIHNKKDTSNKVSQNYDAAVLGHYLFFDKNLSANKKVSCASCHQPDKYFTDGLQTGEGIAKAFRNTPTVVSASHSLWLFHDGRADSLWAQALGPLENTKEHGTNRHDIVHYINNSPSLKKLYEKPFGLMTENTNNNVNDVFANVGKSIAAYEEKLQHGSSRFDRYLDAIENNSHQDKNILNKQEQAGLKLFIRPTSCIMCHNGALLSDNGFHNVATVDINNKPYDLGRFEGVKQVLTDEFNCKSRYNDNKNATCEEHKYMPIDQHQTLSAFKTPGLRNVAKTAPYMHDGQFADLDSVLKHYANPDKLIIGQKDLLAVTLSEQDQSDLVAFLKSLNSEVNADKQWLSAPHK